MATSIILGSGELGSNIAYSILKNDPDSKVTIVDTLDPRRVWNHVELGYMKKTDSSNINARLNTVHTSEMDTESMLDDLYSIPGVDEYNCVIFANGELNQTYMTKCPNWNTYVGIDYTTKLIDAFRRLTSLNGKLILCSHWSVYGEQDARVMPFKEDLIPNPVGLRGTIKHMQETILKGMCKQYGIDYTIFRISTTCGLYTDSSNLVNTMIKNVVYQEPIQIHGLGEQSRDLVNIEDVSDIIRLAINSNKVNNQTYNLGGNDSLNMAKKQIQETEKTMNKIAKAITDILAPIHENPRYNIINVNVDPNDKESQLRVILSNKKLKDDLGTIPETAEAVMLRKAITYMSSYVLDLDKDILDRIKVMLNQKMATSTSDENIKFFERRYGISRNLKTQTTKKEEKKIVKI